MGSRKCLVDTLPEELLVHIVQFASELDEDEEELDTVSAAREGIRITRNLCLVSRRFARVATPALYSTYPHVDSDRAWAFLRTLVQSPELASLVKAVFYSYDIYKRRSPPTFPDKERKGFKNQLRRNGIPMEGIYVRDDNFLMHCEPELKFILCLTPNVTNVSFLKEPARIPVDRTPLWLTPIARAAAGLPFGKVHAFKSLSTMNLEVLSISLTQVSHVLKLPSLRTLYIDKAKLAWTDQEGLSEWACSPRTSAVRNLSFYECALQQEVLNLFVGSCTALEGFSYYELNSGRTLDLELAPFAHTLEAHHESLRRIQIDLPQGQHATYNTSLSTFGSLRHYTKLEVLSCPSLTFDPEGLDDTDSSKVVDKARLRMLADFLPESITQVTVLSSDWEMQRAYRVLLPLAWLAKHPDWGLFPALRCVELHTTVHHHREELGKHDFYTEALSRLFKGAGSSQAMSKPIKVHWYMQLAQSPRARPEERFPGRRSSFMYRGAEPKEDITEEDFERAVVELQELMGKGD